MLHLYALCNTVISQKCRICVTLLIQITTNVFIQEEQKPSYRLSTLLELPSCFLFLTCRIYYLSKLELTDHCSLQWVISLVLVLLFQGSLWDLKLYYSSSREIPNRRDSASRAKSANSVLHFKLLQKYWCSTAWERHWKCRGGEW